MIKENVEQYIEIAANGQKIYRKYTIGDEAADLFMNQFQKLLS